MKKKVNYKQPIEFEDDGQEAILQIFGENLKNLRDSKELSQEMVAFTSGLSRSYYAEIELGRRNVSLINITKIAVALDVELNDLLALSDSKKFFK